MIEVLGPNGIDDTVALQTAISDAFAEGLTYPDGPLGPQAHVLLPAGRWRFRRIDWPSNLRLVVDAGATIQPAPGMGWNPKTGAWERFTLLGWGADGNHPTPIENVSLVSTGQAWTAPKRAYVDSDAGRDILTKVDVQRCFTFNLDPNTNPAQPFTNSILAVEPVAVTGCEIEGAFFVFNDDNGTASDVSYPWPTSGNSAIVPHAAKSSPIGDDPDTFIQPRQMRLGRIAGYRAPRGYGVIQLNACIGLEVGTMVCKGGTTLRMETDGSLKSEAGGVDRGAIVDDVFCSYAGNVDGNRAVSLSPHSQRNGTVHVVEAVSDDSFETVVASRSGRQGGSFTKATVEVIRSTPGPNAQTRSDGIHLWGTVQSRTPLSIDGGLTWRDNLSVPQPEVGPGTFTDFR